MKKYTYSEKKDTRSGFGAGLHELGKKNPNVVALCADLIGSLKMNAFVEENPERFFQTGIAEANMIGMAAGFGFFSLAFIVTVLVLLILIIVNILEKPIKKISEEKDASR